VQPKITPENLEVKINDKNAYLSQIVKKNRLHKQNQLENFKEKLEKDFNLLAEFQIPCVENQNKLEQKIKNFYEKPHIFAFIEAKSSLP